MGAAAGTDARQLRLVVELFGTQLVGPHAGRVDHIRGAYLELRAALSIEREHSSRTPVSLEQAADPQAIGADRAEALGLAEHRQHEAHVVGLAVIEQVAARRLATAGRRPCAPRSPGSSAGKRRQQLNHFLAGDHAMALGAPGFPLRREQVPLARL